MEHLRSRRLTKQPPVNNTTIDSRLGPDNESSSRRRPSGPHSPASDLSRDNGDSRTYSSSHTSSTSSVEPSPNLATSKFGAQAQQEPYTNRHRFSLRRSLNARTSDELMGSDPTSNSALDSTKASGYQNSLRRPGPPPLSHTSPDPRMISPQLRQSASFSTVDRSVDITPPRSDTGLTASKRYSDEARTSGLWRKKSGFSSFVNSVLGSPRAVKISAPGNPVHVTHVGFDNETGQFTVCIPFECLTLNIFNAVMSLQSALHHDSKADTLQGSSQRMAASPAGKWHRRNGTERKSTSNR